MLEGRDRFATTTQAEQDLVGITPAGGSIRRGWHRHRHLAGALSWATLRVSAVAA